MQLKHHALNITCAVLLGACSDSTTTVDGPSATPTPPAATAEVAATPTITFTPNSVRVLAGGTVTFDFGGVAHNVYFDDAPAGAPANITGENKNTSHSLTFSTPGTFTYNCHIHPGMRGTVVVVNPSDSTSNDMPGTGSGYVRGASHRTPR
jgi:plastocyanin